MIDRARLAGVLYLLTIVTGVFAEVFVRGALVVPNDPAATATNILAHESLYRTGLASDLVMLAAYVAVTLLFFVLFEPVDRSLSLLAAFFSLIGIAVLAANSVNHIAPLLLLRGPAASPSLALFFLRLHSRGYGLAVVFFGVYCVLLGRLIYRSGFLPRILGVLMMIGGAGYLIGSLTPLLWPAVHLPDLSILGGIAELALTLWLIVKGAAR
jgi:hypothetical protein